MKRVIVIGSGGAGKSTFSRRLGDALGIEVIHLDQLYWQPNWVEPAKAEWAAKIESLVKRDSWIMDGNFGGTRTIRVKACDTVILLDLPRSTCTFRVLKRRWKYRGRNRPEMAVGCPEKIDLKFLLWVWNFPKKKKPGILAEFEHFPNKEIVILRSDREVEEFLKLCI
ncbi:MAG: DNA topology modulation protein [Pyrinomonadaceae bacterium]